MPPKKAQAKKKSGYQLAEKFNKGTQVKDIFKNTWEIGEPIGQGGFGLIYLAFIKSASINRISDSTAEFVIKIEPKDNGPLFCETHFYANCAKEEEISSFAKAYRLKHVGIPKFISSGLCDYNEKSFRFIIMNRFTRDLQTILNESQGILKESSVLYLTRQMLYSLEYIHLKGYAHGDIKAANIMLRSDNEAFLVDFGLAQRFSRDGTHQAYNPKSDRRHNGTIEFTSRDAHAGVTPNRRADLEILLYCVLQWLSGTLPWMDLLTRPEEVQKSKVKYMERGKEFLEVCFKNAKNTVQSKTIAFLEFFLNEINKYEYEDEPNYLLIHSKLTDTIKACGYSNDENFELLAKQKKSTLKKATISKIDTNDEDDFKDAKQAKKAIVYVSDTSDDEENSNKKVSYEKERMIGLVNTKDQLQLSYFNRKQKSSNDHEVSSEPKCTVRQLRNYGKIDYTQMFLLEEKTTAKKKAATNQQITSDDDSEKEQKALASNSKPRIPNLSNSAHKQMTPQIDRAKHLQQQQPRSPLALSNLDYTQNNDKNTRPRGMLLKKRTNVPKSTVSTQTDVSCFAQAYEEDTNNDDY